MPFPIYKLFIFCFLLPYFTAFPQYKPKQCLRYRENDIFLDTCPAYFQDTVDFSAALFPDPVVLSNLSNSNHISATKSAQSGTSSIPSKNRSSEINGTKPLMSFEEWQKKLQQNENDKDRARLKGKLNTEERQQMLDSIDGGFSDDFGAMLEGFMGTSKKSPNVYAEGQYISPSKSSSSGDRKPFADVRIKSLKERFNYASIDCAATVRKANREAKSAQSILYESKDQYLLNKCSASKFVILNLCEQIVVDTIVMANFEFFSSTFKDFRVYASSKYPTSEWKFLGQWQARNTRDLQVFKVPDRVFVEYLKIEFLTHYGHEYYCPLSLVRVHGMSNMEFYTIVESQDDNLARENEHLWPAEVRENIIQPELDITIAPDTSYVKPDTEESDKSVISPIEPTSLPSFDIPDIEFDLLKDTSSPGSFSKENKHDDIILEIHEPDERSAYLPVASSIDVIDIEEPIIPTVFFMEESSQTKDFPTLDSSSVSASPSDFVASINMPELEYSADEAIQEDEALSDDELESVQDTNATYKTTSSSLALQKTNLYAKEGSTQESIYKTIMKRLSVLEQNMKLSQRFLDDQNKILNDVFVDMEKKHQDQLILLIGHLNETASQKIDHMKRRYEQWYEDLKEQNENDMRDMTAKISILADQMSAQRFLAIGQFIVTLIVFVFTALSGGTFSTLSPVVEAQQKERKRRESLSSRAKDMLDSLIENRMNPTPKQPSVSEMPSTEKFMGENKLFLILNKPKEMKPKKPNNPRRHSDSPYHTMKEIDINSPSSTTEKVQPTISRTSTIGNRDENKIPNKSGQSSRNASDEFFNTSNLQSDVLYKKLDDIVVEQQRQESQNLHRKVSKENHSSFENLRSKEYK